MKRTIVFFYTFLFVSIAQKSAIFFYLLTDGMLLLYQWKRGYLMEKQTRQVVEQLFDLTANGGSPLEISELFSDKVDFMITGDTLHVPWIGKKIGKTGAASFYEGINKYIDSLEFEIEEILIKNQRAVVLGHLVSKVKETEKNIETEFAYDITVEDNKIIRFRMFEDSFAVSEAVR